MARRRETTRYPFAYPHGVRGYTERRKAQIASQAPGVEV